MYVSHRHVERVDLRVRGAVDGSLRLVAGDVEQGTIPELVRPLHLQGRFTEGTGAVVVELGAGGGAHRCYNDKHTQVVDTMTLTPPQ